MKTRGKIKNLFLLPRKTSILLVIWSAEFILHMNAK